MNAHQGKRFVTSGYRAITDYIEEQNKSRVLYSELECLVNEDMIKKGYHFQSKQDIKTYWEQLLS